MAQTTLHVLAVLTVALVLLGVLELWRHRRNLAQIPIRVHVNGTRGKSSVTRLIAAGLTEGGIPAAAKTTGTLARMIFPEGRELPVFRASQPNIIEQVRIVAAARAASVRALVLECMALTPELQALSEAKLIRATHGVITNARPDHLDIMGPTERDVATALAATTPFHGKLFTTERTHLEVFAAAARDRQTALVAVDDAEIATVSREELAGFSYTEHAENVALALRVCADLGVPRAVALAGMWNAPPDPGAMTEHEIDFFGRRLVFVNGFAANDPVSTRRLWEMAVVKYQDVERRVAIFNCRADRVARSVQLAHDVVAWPAADHLVLMGTGTYLFARAATEAGLDASKLVFAENQTVEEVFEATIGLSGRSALVMGMGNTGGQGLALVQCFKNRSRLARGPTESVR
jgi:gamma-polyglutamate synthase